METSSIDSPNIATAFNRDRPTDLSLQIPDSIESLIEEIALVQVMFRLYQVDESSPRVQRFLQQLGRTSLNDCCRYDLQLLGQAMRRDWLSQPPEYGQKFAACTQLLQALKLDWEHPVIQAFFKSGDGMSLAMLERLRIGLEAELRAVQAPTVQSQQSS